MTRWSHIPPKPIIIVAAQLALLAQTIGFRRLAPHPPKDMVAMLAFCIGGIPRAQSSLQANVVATMFTPLKRKTSRQRRLRSQPAARSDEGNGFDAHFQAHSSRACDKCRESPRLDGCGIIAILWLLVAAAACGCRRLVARAYPL